MRSIASETVHRATHPAYKQWIRRAGTAGGGPFPGMIGRKLLTALVATALYAVVLVTTASAEMRQVRVTLVTGQVMTLTVDVPPGTSVQQLEIPGLPAPVKLIEDLGPVATATPTPTPTVPPLPTEVPEAETPTPTPTPGNQQGGGSGGRGGDSGGGNRGSDGGTTNTGGGQGSARPEDIARDVGGREKGNAESAVGRAKEKVRAGVEETVERTREPRDEDTAPAPSDPTYSLATPGPARIGVPNFFIDKFRIPPFLLPIYQAAGIEYGVRWEILAAINEIETDYGRNLNVSSAGAVGWMQFLPSTWRVYGVDGNGDKVKDPYNPVDAIFAAARYLRAAGADQDLRAAIFAYNHADWYVDSVLLRAQLIGGLPANLVGSLTGLTQGRFPVHAKATYAGQLTRRGNRVREGNAAMVVESEQRRGVRVYSRSGAPAVAVNDGRIVNIGRSERLGRFVMVQDVYGNTYTYAHLDRIATRYPTAKPRTITRDKYALPARDPQPTEPASSTDRPARKAPARKLAERAAPSGRKVTPPPVKERLFAHPDRPNSADAGGAQQQFERTGLIDGETFDTYLQRIFGLDRDEIQLKRLREGSRVVAGTVLGRVGRTGRGAPHLLFEIRPAGRGAPRIDPKPILDGWKLLESTEIYRAAGKNPFFGRDAANPSIGQILLMSKEALVERVLSNPHIELYDCGRQDVQTGQVDRRVLATLEFLAASGLRPTVTSLKCGHSFLTKSGNVSHHSSGNAVDIAAINGVTITPETQGAGSITELTIQRLLTLQGTMKPDQIISLMEFEGTDNTYAMADHADHIHVGWRPLYGTNPKLARQVNAILKPKQWIKLIDRLGEIDNPTVRRKPSRFALEHASHAHKGE
jgi:murein DD-endopeptidase MepM/ murein hydrolase activator NlpD